MVAFAKSKRSIHGRYLGINYEHTRNELAGCLNDAHDWCKAHEQFLATQDLLLESEATKAGIFRWVKEALARLKPDDWLILTISGHGSIRRAPRGSAEPSGNDQLFLPYDFDQGNFIFDNEWYDLLRKRDPASRVLFITDCCYSGTLARGLQKIRPRSIPFHTVALGTHQDHRDKLYVPRPRSEADGIAEGVVHISGCKDDEVSYDATFKNRANGALTHFAIDALQDLKPGATFLDWKRAIGDRLPTKKFQQSPQMNASEMFWSQVVPGYEVESLPPLEDAPPPAASLRVGRWEGEVTNWRRAQE